MTLASVDPSFRPYAYGKDAASALASTTCSGASPGSVLASALAQHLPQEEGSAVFPQVRQVISPTGTPATQAPGTVLTTTNLKTKVSRPNSPTRVNFDKTLLAAHNRVICPAALASTPTAAAQALANSKPPAFTAAPPCSSSSYTFAPTSLTSCSAALHIPHMPSSPLVFPRALGQNQTSSASASASSAAATPVPVPGSLSCTPLSSTSSSPAASPIRYGTVTTGQQPSAVPTYALIQQHLQSQLQHSQYPAHLVVGSQPIDYFSIPVSVPTVSSAGQPCGSGSVPSAFVAFGNSPYPTPTSEFTAAPSIMAPAIASALPLIPAQTPQTPADPYAFMSGVVTSAGFPVGTAAAAAAYAHHPLLGTQAPPGPYQIRILGVPSVGAKSRVETQIKLCLQLVSASGEKVTRYRRLRIPDLLVANERWKRHGQLASARGAAAAGIPGLVEPSSMSEERDTLWLHGKVICASDPEKLVKVCSGCVQREAKRASRRKYPPKPLPGEPVTLPTPPSSLSNSPTPGSAGRTAVPAVSDITMSERKTMLIHAPPVLDFASGDAMLPTRIPCYCRHHKEKLGFILQFELHDTQGRVVAKGESAPILITDDHKTSKKSQPKASDEGVETSDGNAGESIEEVQAQQQQLAHGVKRPSPDGETSVSSSSSSSASASADEQSPEALPFASPMSLLGLPNIRLPPSSAAPLVNMPPASAMPPSPRLSPTSASSPQGALESQQPGPKSDVEMFGADLLSQVMYLPNMSSAPDSSASVLSSVQSPPQSMSLDSNNHVRKRPRVTPPPPLLNGIAAPGSQVASPISPPHTAKGSPNKNVLLGNLVFAPAAPMSPSPQRGAVPTGTISPSALSFGATSSSSAASTATAADIEAFTAAIQQPYMAALQMPGSGAANPALAAMTTMQPLTLPIVTSSAAMDTSSLFQHMSTTAQQQQQPQAQSQLPQQQPIPLAQFLQAAGAISAVVPQQHMPLMTTQVGVAQPPQQVTAIAMPAAPAPSSTSWLPKLERVVPNEGPLQGGIEVTVLGTGFNESLTVQFGSVPAHTVYWSPNTLVCTVPPGTQPGPVPVVIKQVADLGLTDTNQVQAPPVTFTYKDANSERQLLELALTLLGYNLAPSSTATSPSPNTTASQSTLNPSSLFSLLGGGGGYGHQHLDATTDSILHMLTDATAATSPLELAALRAVQRMVATHPPASDTSAATVLDARRSGTGAAMVHLATANRFGRLLRWLVKEAKVDAGVRDGLGRTPLEIARQDGWTEGVDLLSGVFESTTDGTQAKPRSVSPVKNKDNGTGTADKKGSVVLLDKVEDALIQSALEKEKTILLTGSVAPTTLDPVVATPASSSSAAIAAHTVSATNNTLTGWHIHTRIAATFREPATRWIIQLVLITMLIAAAALQVQQAIVYQGDVWLAKAAKSTLVGVSDALSWLDFPEDAAPAPGAHVEDDDGAIVGGAKWQRAVDVLWAAQPDGHKQAHGPRACKVVDQESGRCAEDASTAAGEPEDLWELGRSWRMAVS